MTNEDLTASVARKQERVFFGIIFKTFRTKNAFSKKDRKNLVTYQSFFKNIHTLYS